MGKEYKKRKLDTVVEEIQEQATRLWKRLQEFEPEDMARHKALELRHEKYSCGIRYVWSIICRYCATKRSQGVVEAFF